MPNLTHLFLENDQKILEITAELWGIEYSAPDLRTGAQTLPDLMINDTLVYELLGSFPEEALEALGECAATEGRMDWTIFEEKFGKLREMGTSRLEREQPYIFPENVTELLWYHAFIGRGFFETADGPKQFAYIPDDLIPFITVKQPKSQFYGRPATEEETSKEFVTEHSIVDQATSILAGVRTGLTPDEIIAFETQRMPFAYHTLEHILMEYGLIDPSQNINPDETRKFLESGRRQAHLDLVNTWYSSAIHNDLAFMPGIEIKAELPYTPWKFRTKLIEIIRQLPKYNWWNLATFITAIEQNEPDILRPISEFDTWYLRDSITEESLRGRENWQKVEGRLIRYMITGPLYLFGLVDLAGETEAEITSFRLSWRANSLLDNQLPEKGTGKPPQLHLDSRGRLFIPPKYSRSRRYQISRFCNWVGWKKDRYQYQITARSLEQAARQGLTPAQLATLLRQDPELEIPPNILSALNRFQQSGSQAHIETRVILEVKDPKIINELQQNKFALKYIIEQIGPNSLAIQPGALPQISQMITEMGYFCDTGE